MNKMGSFAKTDTQKSGLWLGEDGDDLRVLFRKGSLDGGVYIKCSIATFSKMRILLRVSLVL